MAPARLLHANNFFRVRVKNLCSCEKCDGCRGRGVIWVFDEITRRKRVNVSLDVCLVFPIDFFPSLLMNGS